MKRGINRKKEMKEIIVNKDELLWIVETLENDLMNINDWENYLLTREDIQTLKDRLERSL